MPFFIFLELRPEEPVSGVLLLGGVLVRLLDGVVNGVHWAGVLGELFHDLFDAGEMLDAGDLERKKNIINYKTLAIAIGA